MGKIKIVLAIVVIYFIYKGFTGIMSSKKKCLKNKEIAELTSSTYYECAEVNAVVKGGKIISVIKKMKIFK